MALADILRDPSNDSLGALASKWGVSESSARRIFANCAGISPKRFAQFCASRIGMESLSAGSSALDANLDAGGTSAGFLHALTCTCEALSPGEVASQGAGLLIVHAFIPTLMGWALAARTSRGIAHLDFVEDGLTARRAALASLQSRFPNALMSEDEAAFDDLRTALGVDRAPARLHLLVSGTNFQMKAWQAILGVGPGSTVSYAQLAARAGSPGAARAAGSAMAANSLALLIPCHRALRADGSSGGYRWGHWRKQALLALEAGVKPGRLHEAPKTIKT